MYENGFTGSGNYLIPEYYPDKKIPVPIANGAIYSVDHEGNEVMVGYYDKDIKKFMEV